MSSNPNSSDFNYKDYSLEKLQDWVHDAIDGDASPHEIYSSIREAVREDYYYHKDYASRAYGLLELLNGHRPVEDESFDLTVTGEKFPRACDRDDPSPECKKDWVDFWEETYYPEEYKKAKEPKVKDVMPPWGHSDMEALRYTEEELNAMCDKASSDQEKDKCREYNLREAEYYNQRAKLDAEYEAIKAAGGYEWTPEPPKDKVVKWQLSIQQSYVDGVEDYFVTFPDDLLEAANLKEGDIVEWVDKGDGSFLLRKVS